MEKEKVISAYVGFKGELWQKEINVADFIEKNYKEYRGDDSFLVGKSKKTAFRGCFFVFNSTYSLHGR